jgi:hypothetical protein
MQDDLKPIGKLDPNQTYVVRNTILLKSESSIVKGCAGRALDDGTIELLPLHPSHQDSPATAATEIGLVNMPTLEHGGSLGGKD